MTIRSISLRKFSSAIAALSLIIMASCGGGGGGDTSPPQPPPLSSDASLASLSGTGFTLDPVFSTNQLNYNGSVDFAVSSVQVTPTSADSNASIAVNGVTVASGSSSDDLAIDVGDNTITINVTAQNGTTSQTYTIVVTPSTFAQTAYVKASNSEADDEFGAVGLSGDGQTMVVGAWREGSMATGINGDETNNSSPVSGAAYIFRRGIAGDWSQEAYLKPSNTGSDDEFGFSVAISDDGTTVAISANAESSAATGIDGDQTNNAALYSGAVYVFIRDVGGNWNQQAYIKASNTDAGDFFGLDIDLSGDGSTLAVVAARESSSAVGVNGDDSNNAAFESGAAYVFARDDAGVWSQQAYVKASNTTATDYFGGAVALSGDGMTLAVSSLDDSSSTGVNGDQANSGAEWSGAVFVYTRDTANVWTQEAYIKASNTGIDDLFGYALALSNDGSTLAVSANFEDSVATGIGGDESDNNADSAGAVYIFRRITGTWSQQAYLKASNTDAVDLFGRDIDIADDGRMLAVSAIGEDSLATGINGEQTDNTALWSGAVYVFTLDSTGSWKQQAYVKASNTGVNDSFGGSVALSGDGTVLSVGALTESSAATGINGDQDDNSATWSGAAYIFEL